MGVCRCKKRTELWCYKTTKPVCLDCIVDIDHQLSLVAPYIDWLNNPVDHDLVCPLSQEPLVDISNSIRFINLQVFSLSAVNDYLSKLPPNTAAAGFTIPGTDIPMLPAVTDQSKLAQQIREKLKDSPNISKVIESQKESIQAALTAPHSPIQEGSLMTRKNVQKFSDASDVVISGMESGKVGSRTGPKGKFERIKKRLKTCFKSMKWKQVIIIFIVCIIILYILLSLFNFIEYEITSLLPADMFHVSKAKEAIEVVQKPAKLAEQIKNVVAENLE